MSKSNQYIPRKGDFAKFNNKSAPAMRYNNRWARVMKGGTDCVILSYPFYLRRSMIEVKAQKLIFHRGGFEFTTPSC